MIVLDASAGVDWLLQTPAGHQIETRTYSRNETLHTVHLLDLEVTSVLRRLSAKGTVTTHRADQAVQDLLDLRITRYDISRCCPEFGSSVTISLPATLLTSPLITRDARLASTTGHSAFIELF